MLTIPVAEAAQKQLEFRLVDGGVWSYRPSTHQTLRVLDGEAYVTVQGCRDDLFLTEGQAQQLPAHKLAVIQGSSSATFILQ